MPFWDCECGGYDCECDATGVCCALGASCDFCRAHACSSCHQVSLSLGTPFVSQTLILTLLCIRVFKLPLVLSLSICCATAGNVAQHLYFTLSRTPPLAHACLSYHQYFLCLGVASLFHTLAHTLPSLTHACWNGHQYSLPLGMARLFNTLTHPPPYIRMWNCHQYSLPLGVASLFHTLVHTLHSLCKRMFELTSVFSASRHGFSFSHSRAHTPSHMRVQISACSNFSFSSRNFALYHVLTHTFKHTLLQVQPWGG